MGVCTKYYYGLSTSRNGQQTSAKYILTIQEMAELILTVNQIEPQSFLYMVINVNIPSSDFTNLPMTPHQSVFESVFVFDLQKYKMSLEESHYLYEMQTTIC